MLARLVCFVVGYTFGCFLTADFVCHRVRHASAFDVGLGNPGMANIASELGVGWGLVVLAGDVLKVVAASLICLAVFPTLGLGTCGLWAGLGATVGHDYPVWHRFSGGKGVTTSCSAIILGRPVTGVASTLVGFVVILATKYLCLGALAIPAAFVALAAILGDTQATLVGLVLLGLALAEHAGAARGIRTGETKQTDLLAKLRELRTK